MLGWPRWPEGEGRLNPPDFVLLILRFQQNPFWVESPGAARGNLLGCGREECRRGRSGRPRGPAPSLRSPAGTHAGLGITYPRKLGRAAILVDPASENHRGDWILIKTRGARSFAPLCGLSVFASLLLFFLSPFSRHLFRRG